MPEFQENERFFVAMEEVVGDVLTEVHIREDHKPLRTPATRELLASLNGQLAPTIEDLHKRFGEPGQEPADFIVEASESLLTLAFDYGFRAGRIWEARDYGVDIPEDRTE